MISPMDQPKKRCSVKKILVLLIFLAISAVNYGWGQQTLPGNDQYDQGRKIYNATCRVCHILKSEGDDPTHYYLRFRPADFSDPDFWKNHDNQKIENVIRRGKGNMPPQPLGSEDIK